jgi:hypothetical protein
VFDPEPLKQIAAELADQIPQPGQGRFDSIGKTMTAVDGSVVDTIVRVARLAWLPKAGGKMNCGYARFTLWNDIHAADSSYVCRVRDNSVSEIIEEKELTGRIARRA